MRCAGEGGEKKALCFTTVQPIVRHYRQVALFADTDLHNVIRRGTILKDIHKRFIMYQLFKATKYIHSGNVIHRDQKVGNFLLYHSLDSKTKVSDL